MCLVCVYIVWMVRVNSWQILTQVCYFVLVTQYWGIVTVPGFPWGGPRSTNPRNVIALQRLRAPLPQREKLEEHMFKCILSFFLAILKPCQRLASVLLVVRTKCQHAKGWSMFYEQSKSFHRFLYLFQRDTFEMMFRELSDWYPPETTE